MLKIDLSKCIGCGACVGVCPVNCLTCKDTYVECDQARCIKCGTCPKVCVAGALKLEK